MAQLSNNLKLKRLQTYVNNFVVVMIKKKLLKINDHQVKIK